MVQLKYVFDKTVASKPNNWRALASFSQNSQTKYLHSFLPYFCFFTSNSSVYVVLTYFWCDCVISLFKKEFWSSDSHGGKGFFKNSIIIRHVTKRGKANCSQAKGHPSSDILMRLYQIRTFFFFLVGNLWNMLLVKTIFVKVYHKIIQIYLLNAFYIIDVIILRAWQTLSLVSSTTTQWDCLWVVFLMQVKLRPQISQ